jgi:hypothetical protein
MHRGIPRGKSVVFLPTWYGVVDPEIRCLRRQHA